MEGGWRGHGGGGGGAVEGSGGGVEGGWGWVGRSTEDGLTGYINRSFPTKI